MENQNDQELLELLEELLKENVQDDSNNSKTLPLMISVMGHYSGRGNVPAKVCNLQFMLIDSETKEPSKINLIRSRVTRSQPKGNKRVSTDIEPNQDYTLLKYFERYPEDWNYAHGYIHFRCPELRKNKTLAIKGDNGEGKAVHIDVRKHENGSWHGPVIHREVKITMDKWVYIPLNF